MEEVKKKEPVRKIKKEKLSKKEKEEIKKQKEYWADVFYNLENFDGTPQSQKEVRNVG